MSILNLNSMNHGLPLSLSGITHPHSLSTEMADHDRRREAMKKQRKAKRGVTIADQERGIIVISHEEGIIRGGEEIEGDLARVLNELSFLFLNCTAKAA